MKVVLMIVRKTKKSRRTVGKRSGAVGKHYFPFDPQLAREIAKKGGTAVHIYVFLLLCRGAGRDRVTSWTSHSSGTYLHFTKTESEKACAWLADHGYIKAISHASAEELENKYSEWRAGRGPIPMRWSIVPKSDYFFPNSLIKELGVLYEATGPIKFVSHAAKIRLDQILLLLYLYENSDMKKHGGVDPAVWATSYNVTIPFIEIPGADGAYLGGISEGGEFMSERLIDAMLLNDSDKDIAKKRIELAIKNLESNKFIHRALYVIEPDIAGIKGEISYTLYHMDEWFRITRQSNCLASHINDFGKKMLSGIEDFRLFQKNGAYHNGNTKKFSIFTYDKEVYAHSVLVPTHLANTQDMDNGKQAGFNKNVEWIRQLGLTEKLMERDPSDMFFDSMVD